MWLKALALTAMMGAAVAVGSAPSSAEADVRVYRGPSGTYVAARRGYRSPYYGYGYSYPYYSSYSYRYPSYGYAYSYPSYYSSPYYYSTPYYGYNYGYSYPSYGRRGAFIGPNGAAFYGPRGGFRIRY